MPAGIADVNPEAIISRGTVVDRLRLPLGGVTIHAIHKGKTPYLVCRGQDNKGHVTSCH